MIAAAGLALMFGATLASAYWLSAAGAVIALAAFVLWAWEPSDSGVLRDAGMGLTLPVNPAERRSHTHVGTAGTMLVLMALFASLIFGLLYLWNTQPQFAEAAARPLILPAAAAGAAGLGVALLGQLTRRAALRGRTGAAGALAVLAAAAAAGGALGWALRRWIPGAPLWARRSGPLPDSSH